MRPPRRKPLQALLVILALFDQYFSLDGQLPAPTMSISASAQNDRDYDASRPGQQSLIVYTITNTSASLGVYDMIGFTLPAGTNDGLYKVVPSGGMMVWSSSLNATSTVSRRTSSGMPAGAAGTLTVYADSPHTRLGYATADSIDDGPFVPVLVPVPAQPPSPPVLTAIVVSSQTVMLSGASLISGYSYTLERSSGGLIWTSDQAFWATNTMQSLLTRPLTNGPAQWFRLRSP